MAFETIDIKYESGFQALHIPEKLKINDDKVYIKQLGNVLYIIPFHNPWQVFFDSLEKFSPDFMENREQYTNEKREDLE